MNVVSQSVSSTDIIKDAFDFTVDKFPLVGPDNMRTPHYGLFRSDTRECVGRACAKRYVPHKTEDLVAIAEATREAFGDDVETKCHFRDGHFLSMMPGVKYRQSVYGTTDNVFPAVIVKAMFNGQSFKGTLGFFRDACRNMAMLRQVKGVNMAIRHTVNLQSNMDILVQDMGNLTSHWDEVKTAILNMEAKTVKLKDFLESVYPEPPVEEKSKHSRHVKRVKAIEDRIERERSETGRGPHAGSVSGWEAFNGVQGYHQWESTRRAGFTGDFDRILRAMSETAVSRAEEVVLAA